VSFAAVTLRVASERVFLVVGVYFVMDSVRKLVEDRLQSSWTAAVRRCYAEIVLKFGMVVVPLKPM
jgi:hypothetical protein